MALSKKTYATGQFPGGQINAVTLEGEIQAETGIVPGLSRIDIVGSNVNIWFKAEINSQEWATLSGIVSSHDGSPSKNDTQEVVVTSGIEQATVNIAGPKNNDGKNVFTVNPFPANIYVYYTANSDLVPSGLRGGGPRFKVAATNSGLYTVDAQFIDVVFMYGGETTIVGETHPDDYANIDLIAPATPVVAASGGTGNCNVIPVGGKQLIIPATGNGAYNVDLEEALNVNLANKSLGKPGLVTKATPVTSFGDSGFWDWDENSGDITPNYTMTGGYNLFADELHMARFGNGIIIHASPLTQYRNVQYNVPVKASKLLPHWIFRGTIHAHGSGNFTAAWMLYTAREYSVD